MSDDIKIAGIIGTTIVLIIGLVAVDAVHKRGTHLECVSTYAYSDKTATDITVICTNKHR